MASVRSINSAKPTERLLTTRRSASIVPLSPKKLSLTKTTPIAVATVKRRKSSRMSTKKSLHTSKTSPGRLDVLLHPSTSIPDPNELAGQMATATLNEIPSPTFSEVYSTASTASNVFESDSTLLDNRQSEESQHDLGASASLSETVTSTSSSRKSSTQDTQFTIDSFDAIRTVGTGRYFLLGS